ncbi:MAG: hypothetical protein KGL53_07320, partial [Elusimicrobia bacterium]|nr:hypothetical protein [Elusimicrobiota bacterium]
VLAAVWVLPPAVSTFRHLCPVRPDGVTEAHAVPAFARRYNMACSQCHTDFPMLNSYGRQFMINGYVRERGKNDSVDNYVQFPDPSSEKLLKNMPVGGLITLTPFSKTNSTDREYQQTAMDAIALFFSGGNLMGDNFSLWSIMEAAHDDTPGTNADTGYYVRFPELQAGWHPSQYFNILAGNRSFYLSDPYQNLSNMGNVTNADRQLVAEGYNAQYALDSADQPNQTMMAYGTLEKEGVGSLYYAGGLSADQKNANGDGPKSVHTRLAYDTLGGLEVGAFGSFGQTGCAANCQATQKFKYSRMGVDALGEFAGFTTRAVYMSAYDRAEDTNARENNRAAYGEVAYSFKKDERPWFVPLFRVDWRQKGNGAQTYADVVGQLAYFYKENVKASIEYMGDTKQDAASGTPRAAKDHYWMGRVQLGF